MTPKREREHLSTDVTDMYSRGCIAFVQNFVTHGMLPTLASVAQNHQAVILGQREKKTELMKRSNLLPWKTSGILAELWYVSLYLVDTTCTLNLIETNVGGYVLGVGTSCADSSTC